MEETTASPAPLRTRKKPSYPIGPDLRAYLQKFRRERDLPVTYERLRHFHEAHPLMDSDGRNTLWESVAYQAEEIPALNEDLKRIYALLRVDGDFSVMQHLYIDRVDFCSFGNSTPFRIRIVNAFNDNPITSTSRRPTLRASTASSWNTCSPPTALTSSPTATPSSRSTSPACPATSSAPAGWTVAS